MVSVCAESITLVPMLNRNNRRGKCVCVCVCVCEGW